MVDSLNSWTLGKIVKEGFGNRTQEYANKSLETSWTVVLKAEPSFCWKLFHTCKSHRYKNEIETNKTKTVDLNRNVPRSCSSSCNILCSRTLFFPNPKLVSCFQTLCPKSCFHDPVSRVLSKILFSEPCRRVFGSEALFQDPVHGHLHSDSCNDGSLQPTQRSRQIP